MTKHAIRKPKAYKDERIWPEILEATADGRQVDVALQREGRRDVPEVPEGLSWAMILHGQLETEFGALAARVAVVEAWAVTDSDGLLNVRPAEHPVRKEVVILEARSADGKLHGMREVIRESGKATLGPLWIMERDVPRESVELH